jgi:hypothetical protein
MDIGQMVRSFSAIEKWLPLGILFGRPAFDGGGIRFGMRASRGAIERVRINPFTFEPMIFTVDKRNR